VDCSDTISEQIIRQEQAKALGESTGCFAVDSEVQTVVEDDLGRQMILPLRLADLKVKILKSITRLQNIFPTCR
jgi:hypothetical protein